MAKSDARNANRAIFGVDLQVLLDRDHGRGRNEWELPKFFAQLVEALNRNGEGCFSLSFLCACFMLLVAQGWTWRASSARTAALAGCRR